MNIQELETNFIFRSRPESIPGDLRPLWRVGIILIILLNSSRGSKSSIGRLHILNWAIRKEENRQTILNLISGQRDPDEIVVRVEPSLNKAINYAISEGFIERIKGNRIQITTKGASFAKDLNEHKDAFVEEKLFLSNISTKLTEVLTSRIFDGGY